MDAQQLKKFYLVNDNKTALYEWSSDSFTSKTEFTTTIEGLQNQINTLTAGGLSKEVVTALPSLEDAQPNVIYLVQDSGSLSGDYTEYLCYVDSSGQKHLEKIGTTATDLAQYLTKAEASTTYLSQTDAANTYSTKDEVTGIVGGINSELANKLNSFSTTQSAFDQMNTEGTLQEKSLYLVEQNS